MKNCTNVEIILKDGSTALASAHMDKLITSEVANTIAQINDEYDLTNQSDVITLSEMIADYLKISTEVYVHPKQVCAEFKRQLKFS